MGMWAKRYAFSGSAETLGWSLLRGWAGKLRRTVCFSNTGFRCKRLRRVRWCSSLAVTQVQRETSGDRDVWAFVKVGCRLLEFSHFSGSGGWAKEKSE